MRRLAPFVLLLAARAGLAATVSVPSTFGNVPRCVGKDGVAPVFAQHLGTLASAVSLATPAEGVVSTVLASSAPANACVRVLALEAADEKAVQWKSRELGGNCPGSPLAQGDAFTIPDEVPIAFTDESEAFLLRFEDGADKSECLLTWPDLWSAFYGADVTKTLGEPERYAGSVLHPKKFSAQLFQRESHRALRTCRSHLTGPLADTTPRVFFAALQPPCDETVATANSDGIAPRDLGVDQSLAATGDTAFALCARVPRDDDGEVPAPGDRCIWVGEAEEDARTTLDITAKDSAATTTQRWRLGGTGAGAIGTGGDLKVVALAGEGAIAAPEVTYALSGGDPPAPIDASRDPTIQAFLQRRESYVYAARLVGNAEFTPPDSPCAPTRPDRVGPLQVFETTHGRAPGADAFVCVWRARSDDPEGLVPRSLPSLPETERLGERGAPDAALLSSLTFEACAVKPGASGGALENCQPAWPVNDQGLFAVSLPRAQTATLDAVALVAKPTANATLHFDRPTIELSRRAVRTITTLDSVPEKQARLADPGAKDGPERLRELACFDPPDAARLATGSLVTRSTVEVRGLAGITQAAADSWAFEELGAAHERLLCPQLDPADLARLFDAARSEILAGHEAELVALQGGREVGRRVTLTGPRLPPVTHMTLFASGVPISKLPVDGTFPAIDELCLATDSDWGHELAPFPFDVELETDGHVMVGEVSARGEHGEAVKFTKSERGYCARVTTRPLARVPSDAESVHLDPPRAFSCAATDGGCGGLELASSRAEASSWPPLLQRSHVGLGLSWTEFGVHLPSEDPTPSRQLRAFLATPLVLASVGWAGRVALTADAGLQLSYLTGQETVDAAVATRSAGALGGYATACLETPVVHHWLSFTPELCGAATFDVLQVGAERNARDPNPHVGAELFAGSLQLSLGVTAW